MREAKPRRVGERWQVRLTDEHGKRRKRLFDAYTDAMKALASEQARVAEVKDGLRDPTPADRDGNQAFDYWEQFRVPQKRSGQDDISIFKKHLNSVEASTIEQDGKIQYPGAAAVTGLKVATLQSMECRRQIPHDRLGSAWWSSPRRS